MTSIPSHGPLPLLPSGEESRAHRVMQAEGRRSRGGRSVASDSGGRRDCRASSDKAPQGAGREGLKTSAPRPLRAGRARRALKAPRRPLPKGPAPQRVPEERWSRRLEASRPMRPGRENRGDATGRPTQKFFSSVPSSPSFEAGVRSGRTPGGIPRARDSRPSPSPVRACRLPNRVRYHHACDQLNHFGASRRQFESDIIKATPRTAPLVKH